MDVLLFVPSISTRIASQLQYECQDIVKGKKARFTAKTFSSGEEGKEIVISELDSEKSLTIRNDSNKEYIDVVRQADWSTVAHFVKVFLFEQ
ncbi:hypothetical protein KIN20_004251 [Parelaphostrongylus tenuis]|uniref:Uncharacterized protein n=1 Tax=Parelaphostrongylus tenuis TaxID=148309 RepID=A0AAD5M2U0_PARTN|nr:hypothetical protein KIN20_004251 [Parelaphostrongylus tenuis]